MVTRTFARKAIRKRGPPAGRMRASETAAKAVEPRVQSAAVSAGWRADVDTLVAAQRASCAGLQEVARRHVSLLQEVIAEWRTVSVLMAEIGPKVSVRHLDKLLMANLELVSANVRELAQLTTRSQRDAVDIMRQRFNDHVGGVQRLLRA